MNRQAFGKTDHIRIKEDISTDREANVVRPFPSLWIAFDSDCGFDGMVPDPIFEADLVQQLEQHDSARLQTEV